MNESAKTGVFIVLGAVALVVAFIARPAAPERVAYDDSGERFFAPFDPLDARSLEVIGLDESTAAAQAFKVAHHGGVWSIPSHENYPADAERQLAQAAASVVDLVKGPKVSDRPADHELYGVIDPLADAAVGAGVATRVTMKDEADETLADFLIGKPVKDSDGVRYVRVPGRDRVYAAKVDTTSLSTSFEDWIEDDLLQLEPRDIRRVHVNDYTIDEVAQRIVPGDTLTLDYDAEAATWQLGGLAESEQLRTETVNELKSALDDLKIVDVHRKPAGLGAELRADDALQLDGAAVQSLAARGFYVAGGSLVSNQGETMVTMASGVRYVLRFGEIALGERDTAALEGPEADPAAAGTSRYLFVMVDLDPGAIAEPEYEAVPEIPAADAGADEAAGDADDEAPDDTAGDAADGAGPDPATLRAERDRIIAENEAKRAEHEQKLEEGRQRVTELNDRFADWYYVISDEVYRKIRLGRADLVEAVGEEDT